VLQSRGRSDGVTSPLSEGDDTLRRGILTLPICLVRRGCGSEREEMLELVEPAGFNGRSDMAVRGRYLDTMKQQLHLFTFLKLKHDHGAKSGTRIGANDF
jgi:hypothetical protein